MHRHFHAHAHMATSKGEPTACMFGALKSLKMLCDKFKPQEVIFCKDTGKSFRADLIESYKGERKERDESMFEQFEKAETLMNCLGFPVYGVSGIEADDLCAVFAKQTKSEGLIDIVISGDKDLLQLVDDTTRYYNPGHSKLVSFKGQTVNESNSLEDLWKLSEVHFEVFTMKSEGLPQGVPQSKWILYRSLVGDSSDNLPGVKGVGEKTAFKAVSKFNTVAEIFENRSSLFSERVQSNMDLQQMNLNYALMDLNFVLNSDHFSVITEQLEESKHQDNCEIDLDMFRKLLIKFEFSSILTSLKEFFLNIPNVDYDGKILPR